MDSQDTIHLNRGASVVSDFQRAMQSGRPTDPVLDMAQTLQARGEIEMYVPDTCLDMQESPGKLCEWVYRRGDAEASGRAFEVLKWTRLVASKYNGAFEAQDSAYGPSARALHDTCVSMLSLQNKYEEAKLQFEKYSKIILTVGSTKKQQEEARNHSPEILKSKLVQIDKWVSQKLDEKDLSKQDVCKSLDEHIITFSELLLKLVLSAETEYETTKCTSMSGDDETALCIELDQQLNLQMQDDDAVPPDSDTASSHPVLASPAPGLHVSYIGP